MELGYRMALNKPTIYIRQETLENIPFDIRTINIISYNIKDGGEKTLANVKITKERISNTADHLKYSLHNELDQENLEQRLYHDILEIKATVFPHPMMIKKIRHHNPLSRKTATIVMKNLGKLNHFKSF